MPRILLLLPTTTYRAHDLLDAARRLGVEVIVGSDRRQALESQSGGSTMTLDFQDLECAVREVAAIHQRAPLRAVLGADDETVLLAAAAAAHLGLPHNPPAAVAAAGDKHTFRNAQLAAGLPCPWHRLCDLSVSPEQVASEVPYPCVLKPTFLAASRGVIRADSPDAFVAAWQRVARILADPEVRARGGRRAESILVEAYLPGSEIALEGVLHEGWLQTIALFDKPDALEGPYFEETLYVTPARIAADTAAAVTRAVQQGIRAVGLRAGPVHAEVRVDRGAVTVLEIAPRSIGGLCGRALRFGAGSSLEELILAHALGETTVPDPARRASGVMMIPIPGSGVLRRWRGVADALAVPGVVEVTPGILEGQPVVPLPEGNRYLGFIVARGDHPDDVETSLRRAHGCISVEIAPENGAAARPV